MAKPVIGNDTALKYGKPLDSLIQIRVTEEQKDLIKSAGSADYWRDLMIHHAREILQIQKLPDKGNFSLFEVKEATDAKT